MGQQLANAAGLRRRPEGILLLGNVLSNDDRIFADGTETIGQVFSSVVIHGKNLFFRRVTTCPSEHEGQDRHFSMPPQIAVLAAPPASLALALAALTPSCPAPSLNFHRNALLHDP